MSKSALKRTFWDLWCRIIHFLGFKSSKPPVIQGLRYVIAGNYTIFMNLYAGKPFRPDRLVYVGTDPCKLMGIEGHGRNPDSPYRLIVIRQGWDDESFREFMEMAYAHGFIEPVIH